MKKTDAIAPAPDSRPQANSFFRPLQVDPRLGLGPLVVLDLETRHDSIIAGLASSSRTARSFVQRIEGFSALVAEETAPAAWTVHGLVTRVGHEPELLAAIEDILAPAPTLITYNGLRHDLPVLRRRIMRFRRYDLAAGLQATRLPHVDLHDFPPVPPGANHGSLQDRCAGLGIDSKAYTDGSDDMTATARKSETDVTATFVLLLHELAAVRAHGATWAGGMKALRSAQGGALARKPHLAGLIGRKARSH